jgi:Mg-chelatase subunit ChlD
MLLWNSTDDIEYLYADCAIKTDVVFVIDTSHSVSRSNLTQAKEMILHFTNMTMSNERERGYNRIGIVLIRSTAVVYHPLANSLNKTELLSKITNLQYLPDQYTNTADGLCKMKQQEWRRNQNVLHLAIVLSDGRSNYKSNDPECTGDTEDVANLIHTENEHILVMAVGIGHRIDFEELSTIASGRHLVVELDGYNQTAGIPASLRYQICYTRM